MIYDTFFLSPAHMYEFELHQVAQELVEVFAEMVFCHGYVHGDPHPGNILVHKHPGRKSPNFDIGMSLYNFKCHTSLC